MPYDDAPPSFSDLAGQVQAGNFITAPPTPQDASQGQPSAPSTSDNASAPPSMPYDAQYNIVRNPDGSIMGFDYTSQIGPLGQQPGVKIIATGPEGISDFLQAHPEDPANRPATAQASSAGLTKPDIGASPSFAPDDVQKLLAGGYSLTPPIPSTACPPSPSCA
jgi:hypothetical protein